jgi:uncharacterized membrane protein
VKRVRASIGFWIVLLLTILYAAVTTRTSIQRIIGLQTVGWDITNITQTIWNTAHGDLFAMTNIYPLTNRLGAHVEPLTLLLAPLAWLAGDAPNLALLLLVLQAMVVASGAVPTYLLARVLLKNEFGGVTFALLYLLYPTVGAIVSFEFHMVTLATGFWLWAIYFVHRQKWWGVVTFALLATACKENMPLLLATFGFGGLWFAANRGGLVCRCFFLAPTPFQSQRRKYTDA